MLCSEGELVDTLTKVLTIIILIIFFSALCTPECQNGGSCVLPNLCICTSAYTGASCEILR